MARQTIDISDRNYYQSIVVNGEVVKRGSRSDKRLSMIPWDKWFSGRTVLDIGCNNGMFSLRAAESGAKRVLGVDWNSGVLLARRLAKSAGLNNVSFIRIDLNRPDFYNRINDDFDIIFFCAMLRHIKDKPKMLEWIDIHCRERFIFETNLHQMPIKVLPVYKKYTAFKKFHLLGKSGDANKDDYHLFQANRIGQERGALENKIPITWMPKENVIGGINTVGEAKRKYGKDTHKRLRGNIDKIKEHILVNGLREPIWVVPHKKRPEGYYTVKQGGHRLLALKELDEYFDIPVRIIGGNGG